MLADIVLSPVGLYQSLSGHINAPVGLWFGLIAAGLVVVPFRAYRKLRQSRNELQAQIEGSPQIAVSQMISDNDTVAFLKVRNYGKIGADFVAIAKVIDSNLQGKSYVMCWEPNGQERQHINAGGEGLIRIAQVAKGNPDPDYSNDSVFDGDLVLFTPNQLRVYIETTEKQVEDGKDVIASKVEFRCSIEVSITSEPPMFSGETAHMDKQVYRQRFLLRREENRIVVSPV